MIMIIKIDIMKEIDTIDIINIKIMTDRIITKEKLINQKNKEIVQDLDHVIMKLEDMDLDHLIEIRGL